MSAERSDEEWTLKIRDSTLWPAVRAAGSICSEREKETKQFAAENSLTSVVLYFSGEVSLVGRRCLASSSLSIFLQRSLFTESVAFNYQMSIFRKLFGVLSNWKDWGLGREKDGEEEGNRGRANKGRRVRDHLCAQVSWGARRKTKLAFHVHARHEEAENKQNPHPCISAPFRGNSIHSDAFDHPPATRHSAPLVLPVKLVACDHDFS